MCFAQTVTRNDSAGWTWIDVRWVFFFFRKIGVTEILIFWLFFFKFLTLAVQYNLRHLKLSIFFQASLVDTIFITKIA